MIQISYISSGIVDFQVEIGKSRHMGVSLTVDEALKEYRDYNLKCLVIAPLRGEAYNVEVKLVNERFRELLNTYKDRKVIGLAAVNPWHWEDLKTRIEGYLKRGVFKGIKLFPSIQGFHVNDEIVYPIMDLAAKLRTLVYVPSGYPPQTPLEIADLASLYPEVKIVMGHAGFSDMWIEVASALRRNDNLYVDISTQTQIRAIKRAIRDLGPHKFVYASDMPFSHPRLELYKVKLLGLSEDEKEALLHGNAKELLRVV